MDTCMCLHADLPEGYASLLMAGSQLDSTPSEFSEEVAMPEYWLTDNVHQIAHKAGRL